MRLKLSTLGLILTSSGCCLDIAGETSGATTSAGPAVLVMSCVTAAGVTDGGPIGPVDAGNDPRCPGDWSGVANGDEGKGCSVNGLICTFPEGQAQCAHRSPPKWSLVLRARGCTELPPEIDAGCCSPGLSCAYIPGPPSSDPDATTNYCCDGTSLRWGPLGSFCPNGNTCGTIMASDYDQSCASDSDCVGVAEGDLCNPDTCINCVSGAVSISAQSQYQADLRSKNAGAAMDCPCPPGPLVGCTSGSCGVGCVDAGGKAGANAFIDCCSRVASDAGICE